MHSEREKMGRGLEHSQHSTPFPMIENLIRAEVRNKDGFPEGQNYLMPMTLFKTKSLVHKFKALSIELHCLLKNRSYFETFLLITDLF